MNDTTEYTVTFSFGVGRNYLPRNKRAYKIKYFSDIGDIPSYDHIFRTFHFEFFDFMCFINDLKKELIKHIKQHKKDKK